MRGMMKQSELGIASHQARAIASARNDA